MAVATPPRSRTAPSTGARRFGYAVAAVINLAMLYVVNNLLDWGWPPWLTEEFERVIPLLSFSLIVTMLCNLAWIAYDAAWFKSVGNIVQSVISLFVSVRLLQVFPFDFSSYQFNWELVTRAVLVAAIVGVSIAILVESVKLLSGSSRRGLRSA